MQACALAPVHQGRASGPSGLGQRRVCQGREPPPGSQDCRRADGRAAHKPLFHKHVVVCNLQGNHTNHTDQHISP